MNQLVHDGRFGQADFVVVPASRLRRATGKHCCNDACDARKRTASHAAKTAAGDHGSYVHPSPWSQIMAISTDAKIAARHEPASPTLSELESQIKEKLHFTQHAALRCVTYSIEGDTVILFGRVPSYYLKQLAQVKVTCVPGIERVDNRIEVAVS
jgi:osmotically-inducible protein OsmY